MTDIRCYIWNHKYHADIVGISGEIDEHLDHQLWILIYRLTRERIILPLIRNLNYE